LRLVETLTYKIPEDHVTESEVVTDLDIFVSEAMYE